MHIVNAFIVYPEGEEQEISWSIPMGTLVDLNGHPLELPLPTARMIAYRVQKIRREEGRGETNIYHYLELVGAEELMGFVE